MFVKVAQFNWPLQEIKEVLLNCFFPWIFSNVWQNSFTHINGQTKLKLISVVIKKTYSLDVRTRITRVIFWWDQSTFDTSLCQICSSAIEKSIKLTQTSRIKWLENYERRRTSWELISDNTNQLQTQTDSCSTSHQKVFWNKWQNLPQYLPMHFLLHIIGTSFQVVAKQCTRPTCKSVRWISVNFCEEQIHG